MIDFDVRVNDGGLSGLLGRIVMGDRRRRDLLAEVGKKSVQEVQSNFIAQRSPDGVPWKKSGRAIVTGTPTLINTGRLLNSIVWQAAGADTVKVGTNAIQAGILNFGGLIRAKNAPYLVFKSPYGGIVKVKRVYVPARPFLGVSDRHATSLRSVLGSILRGAAR